MTRTPPSQQRVPQRSLASDDMPRERTLEKPSRQEYLVALPTPMPTPEDLVSHQRRPASAESLQAEPRVIEHRPAEPHSVDTRAKPRVDTPPVKLLYTEPHQIQPRQIEQHHAEQCATEQDVEQPQAEPHPVEPRPAHNIAARPIHDEYGHREQQPPVALSLDRPAAPIPWASATTLSAQDSKRKAVEFPISESDARVLPSSKRPRTGDRPPEENAESLLNRSPRSTRRSSGAAKEPRVKRTIAFKEVYQDGKAQFKHKIFAWPKDSNIWYIVRCDEHQVHFNNGNPIHGAAKHVHSPQHGHLEKRHDLAIEVCGHVVLDCNAELAALNNREFERALKEDKYQVFNMNLLTKEGRRRLTDGPTQFSDAVGSPSSTSTPAKPRSKPSTKPLNDVTKPEECKFYLGFWAPTKKWYMLVMLPIRSDGSLREVGLKEKLQQTDLMGNVPKCYRSDRISLRITGWQPAYSDGGAKANKREYPVMFFDSPVQKHSVGWLPAAKLRPVDLSNPPDDADKKGLAMAREWYAVRMMHRKSWEQYKRLGPGEAPSPTPSEGDAGKGEQWTSLRSAHTDDISPIRGKSNGPGYFFGSGSSEEGSDIGDAEDPMTLDANHVSEAADSNHVNEDSESDNLDVDVDMDNTAGDVSDAVRHQDHWTYNSRSASQRSVHVQEMSLDNEKTEETVIIAPEETATQPDPATPPAEIENQAHATSIAELEHYCKSAQAKALAAVKEAASRSRASSENPEELARFPILPSPQHSTGGAAAAQPLLTFASPPPLTDRKRSTSDDALRQGGAATVTSSGTNSLSESRNPSGLHSILNTDQKISQTETSIETHVDPYKRFEAIRAQMNGLSSRPASVPVYQGSGAEPPFGPPPQSVQVKDLAHKVAQRSPNISHIMSPPLSQSPAMVPARSSSTTPTHGLECVHNTPRVLIPEDAGRWKALRASSSDSVNQPHAAFVETSSSPRTAALQPSAQPVMPLTAQLGTPIHDKYETFDVSQFYDSDGTSWAREDPNKPFLRLITDSMRKWAETARGSALKATIEPAQIEWIETDHPKGDRDKQRVSMMTKNHRKVVLMFETNSANGRSQRAALQGRKFVSWVKRINESVEWRDE